MTSTFQGGLPITASNPGPPPMQRIGMPGAMALMTCAASSAESPNGSAKQVASQHSQAFEAFYANIPSERLLLRC